MENLPTDMSDLSSAFALALKAESVAWNYTCLPFIAFVCHIGMLESLKLKFSQLTDSTLDLSNLLAYRRSTFCSEC